MSAKVVLVSPAVLLILLGVSCGTGGGASSGGEFNWDSITPVAGPGYQPVSFHEMGTLLGFQLILPSYLPDGMSNDVLMPAQEDLLHDQMASGILGLLPAQAGAPFISIEEGRPQPNIPSRGYDPDSDIIRIGQTEVHCKLDTLARGIPLGQTAGEPTRDPGQYPLLVCTWETDELYFDVSFSWELPESGDVTSDMREEAMKVIASMIEDPYIP